MTEKDVRLINTENNVAASAIVTRDIDAAFGGRTGSGCAIKPSRA